jgi:hypothetical protein
MAFTQVLTKMVQAFPGMQNGLNKNKVKPGLNEEASAELRFGVAVKQGTADDGVLACTATNNLIAGIFQQSHALVKDPGTGVGELGDTGLLPGAVGDLAEEGELWVLTEEAVTPSSSVRIRCVAAGAEVAGAFRATADSTDCVDVSDRCKWAGTYASGYALLKFDFRRRAAGTAD